MQAILRRRREAPGMGADATATVSPSATLPVSSTVDLPHLVGGGDSAKVRGGMPMPQAGAPAPAPMPEQRPQPPGPSTITKVGRGFSAAGQAASAASDLGLLDPAVGREVGGALGGAGRLIGAGEAFAAGRPLAGVRQALPALSQLVSPKPAATAEPTPVLCGRKQCLDNIFIERLATGAGLFSAIEHCDVFYGRW